MKLIKSKIQNTLQVELHNYIYLILRDTMLDEIKRNIRMNIERHLDFSKIILSVEDKI